VLSMDARAPVVPVASRESVHAQIKPVVAVEYANAGRRDVSAVRAPRTPELIPVGSLRE
jgi:hypothetical protein